MKLKLTGIVLASLLFLTGCSSGYLEPNSEEIINNGGAYAEEVSTTNLVSQKNSSEPIKKFESESSMILSQYKVYLESKDLKEDVLNITEKAHYFGGFINANKDSDPKNKSKNESIISLKIPKEKSKEFLFYLNNTYYVTSKEVSSADIKNEIEEINMKIKSIKEREERLNNVYNNTQNVEDVFSLDKKLSDLSSKRQSLEKQKSDILEKLDYFKIDIEIKEVKRFSSGEDEGETSKAFKYSLKMIGEAFSFIFMIFVKLLPAIFFSALTIGLLFGLKLFKKWYKKRKKNM